jgi:acetylornithine deacetylase/succinyl-diaminopimelate desuccinylase-like protein
MRQYSKDMDYNEAVLLTQELVRIPSHKDVEDRESKVAEFIYAYCKEKGLEVEYQVVEGKRRNVIARLRGNGTGKTLMLSGHIDTVPPYDMVYDDPYSGDIVDGHLLGRGCNDMKGAVACMITAMVNIKNKGKVLGGDIILAAVAGEEEKSDGTALVVKSGITADGAIEGEPSNYGYSLGHRGLEWIEIKFIGKRAHGATPELGINAISKASKFIQKVETDLMPKLKERKNIYVRDYLDIFFDVAIHPKQDQEPCTGPRGKSRNGRTEAYTSLYVKPGEYYGCGTIWNESYHTCQGRLENAVPK